MNKWMIFQEWPQEANKSAGWVITGGRAHSQLCWIRRGALGSLPLTQNSGWQMNPFRNLGDAFWACFPSKGPYDAALLTTKCFKEVTVHLFPSWGGQLASSPPDTCRLVLSSISIYYFIIQQIFVEQCLSDRTTLGLHMLNRPLQFYLHAIVLHFHSLSLPPFPLFPPHQVPGLISIILSNICLL